ncbi:SDR family oxidoreductase [Aurantiacibacter xanthus]|uniref:SDR family oxidoreductase n=1 Tax=Aurantiacibacter xanthus TaxID=1784712 RepID=A0A3A1P5I5_9SPHN|nr:SDR family oxidoreductase [Aurantiacibacter xanthus]RIV88678.1 SDR family oxidoreductase [Aurantiacibacter xanthus]
MRSVLVTGGARRIGAAIARRFGAAGWHVVVHYRRSRDEAQALAASLPSARTLQCDLADEQACASMARTLASELDDWRALVNCASLFEYDSHDALDPDVFARAMAVNARAQVQLASAFFAHARADGGRRVIQVTDQKLANINPDFFSYTMSKAAVDAAARMLAQAAAPGDRIYRLAPGAILASHDQTDSEAERSHRLNLLRRRTDASEVAEAALFMAEGPLASGQELFVDSGQHLLCQNRDVIYLAREESLSA